MEKDRKNQARGRSSTLEVLGSFSGKPKVQRKWAEQFRILTHLREQFAGQKDAGSRSGKEEVSTFSEHMADAATDSYDRDWALAMLSSAQNALYEIDAALNRIRNGTYGICELTGEPIEPQRLKAIPWARFSARAQAQLESRGTAGRTQLGELGTYFRTAGEQTVPEENDEATEPLKEAA